MRQWVVRPICADCADRMATQKARTADSPSSVLAIAGNLSAHSVWLVAAIASWLLALIVSSMASDIAHADDRPDLIASPSAAFVQRRRTDFFHDTPMVLTAVDEQRVQSVNLPANDTVVAVRIDEFTALENTIETGWRGLAVSTRVLDGEKAGGDRPLPTEFTAQKSDSPQRRGLGEADLASQSEAHFHEGSIWERFRPQILAVIAAMGLQAGLICWLIYEHRLRNLAEIRSRNAMSELANMNRLAAAGELSASIAHEINQPITGMVLKANAALHWLSGEGPDVEKARAAVSDIVDAGHRAGNVIKGMRALFRTGANASVAVDMNNVVGMALNFVRMDLQSNGVRVESKLDESLPAVAGDPVQLQQVILNLVVNAIEAMAAVPNRLLSIRSHQGEPGMVHLSIEDSGPGINEADQQQVFNRLFTTKPAGMGMGLSICRSIIENHRGKIWVSPAPNRGAIFQVELPIAASNV